MTATDITTSSITDDITTTIMINPTCALLGMALDYIWQPFNIDKNESGHVENSKMNLV